MPSSNAEVVGYTQQDGFRSSGINSENVVAAPMYVTEVGWLETIRLYAGGANAPTLARLCIWDREGELQYAGPQQE